MKLGDMKVQIKVEIGELQHKLKIAELKLHNVRLSEEIERLEAALEDVNEVALKAREELKIFHPEYEASRMKSLFDRVFPTDGIWRMIIQK